jgi:hypothetical protein
VSNILSVMLSSEGSEGDCVFSEERSTPSSVDCKAINTNLFAGVERSTPSSVDCKAINTEVFVDLPSKTPGVDVGLWDG